MTIEVVEGDITGLDVDAIVNAANEGCLGGGGVDGAIHRAAGRELYQACLALPEARPGVRCPTGEARITPGFRLKARHVIHTVGPIWHGGGGREAEKLASCYRNSLALAAQHGLHSVAFPAISCGVYGYPLEQAVAVAVREARAWQAQRAQPQRIVFCAFGAGAAAAYRRALEADAA